MIAGVEIKELVTHADERGFFREIVRANDPIFKEGFGQWSHTVTHQGGAKAWHIHQNQIDWWYIPIGAVKVALADRRETSTTYGELMEILMGDQYPAKLLKIPTGVAHGYRVVQGPAHVFYITSNIYNPQDEGRLPHDDPAIGYDWTQGPEIK